MSTPLTEVCNPDFGKNPLGLLFQNLSGLNTLLLLVIYRVLSGVLVVPRDIVFGIFHQINLVFTSFGEVISSGGFQSVLQLPFRIIYRFNQMNLRLLIGASSIPIRIAAIPRNVVRTIIQVVPTVVHSAFNGFITNPINVLSELNPLRIIAHINAMNIRIVAGALTIPIRITRNVLSLPLLIIGGIVSHIPGLNVIAHGIPVLGGAVHMG